MRPVTHSFAVLFDPLEDEESGYSRGETREDQWERERAVEAHISAISLAVYQAAVELGSAYACVERVPRTGETALLLIRGRYECAEGDDLHQALVTRIQHIVRAHELGCANAITHPVLTRRRF